MRGAVAGLARVLGDWVTEVRPATLLADAQAGLLGALLVLPQGIAFATLAGLPPQYGLYSAVVPTIVAALAGSSRHVVSGPTNANSLALAAMLAPLAASGSPAYIELALVVTLMVGLIQTAVGALRLGRIAHFISPAALLGFTSGAAVLIGLHALRDLFDLSMPRGLAPGPMLVAVLTRLGEVRPASLGVGLAALGLALCVKRCAPRWPSMLLGLIGATALASLLPWLAPGMGVGAAALEVRVLGALPSPWPVFHWPQVDLGALPALFDKALALSVVALGQSVAIAQALANRSGQRLDTNREFLGQGLSNVVGGFFSCYLSCGSLNRSLPNLEAGARTPLAAVSAALWMLLLMALSAALLAHIPLAAISGLLLLVAFSLIDTRQWRNMVRLDPSDAFVAAATLAATLLLRLESAILLGTGLSLLVYLYRSSRPAMRTMGFDRAGAERRFVVRDDTPQALPECPQLKLLRMEGSIFFGAAPFVADHLHQLRAAVLAPVYGPDVGLHLAQRHLLVMSKSMNFIDAAGTQLWADELVRRRGLGGDLYFHRPRPQVIEMWTRSGFLEQLGRDHLFPDKRSAIAHIVRQRLDPAICARCEVRVFWECRHDDPGSQI
jgi:sulfate permease, SulP family